MAQDPAAPGRQVEIVRLDFKGTEVDDFPEYLGYLDPFARRLMNRTDILDVLGKMEHPKLSPMPTAAATAAAALPTGAISLAVAPPPVGMPSPSSEPAVPTKGLEEYAATLSKTSRAMAEQATERMAATVHGGENLFAKMLLASCAYAIEFGAFPHPGAEWKIQGHVFKADPQDWNSIRRWTQAIFVLAGVR